MFLALVAAIVVLVLVLVEEKKTPAAPAPAPPAPKPLPSTGQTTQSDNASFPPPSMTTAPIPLPDPVPKKNITINWLFEIGATSVSFAPHPDWSSIEGPLKGNLTLSGGAVASARWMADRPFRYVGLHNTTALARNWETYFGNDPPNAFLTFTDNGSPQAVLVDKCPVGKQHTIIFKVFDPVFTLGTGNTASTLRLTVVEDYTALPRPLVQAGPDAPPADEAEGDKINDAQGRKLEAAQRESREALVARTGSSVSLVVDNAAAGKLVGYWAARATCTAALVAMLDSDGEGEETVGAFATARAISHKAVQKLAKTMETGAIGIVLPVGFLQSPCSD